MIKIALSSLLLLCLLKMSYAQVMNDVNSIHKAIEDINRAAPAGGSDPTQMWETPQYQALEKSAPLIWKTAINNLDEVAPTRSDQSILFQSFEGLSPAEYLQFLDRALDLYSQGKISLGVFKYKVFFPDGKMQLFISHNYDQPEVSTFLERAETIFKQTGEPFIFNIREARSGKLKQLHDAARAQHPELAKQPIPLLHQPSQAADSSSQRIESRPIPTQSKASPNSEGKSSTRFPMGVVAIIVLVIVGAIVFRVRRKRGD